MRRSILILSLLAFAAVLAMSCTSCSPAYVARAGWEEAKILSARQPLDEAIADPSVPSETREKLALVREVRAFAERQLGLDAGDSYTSFTQLDRDTLVMVVSAAAELELRWKTWWFPIVGHLPYKGYFDFDAARGEAESLAAEGYDAYVRPSAAFSTLGWFPDPVLSPSLRGDRQSVVETVIHEITHTTYFPKGQAQFNESFANFVGHAGAIEFYCDALADPEPCSVATDRWHDVRVFGRFFHSLKEPLVDLYASSVPDDEKRVRKREIIEAAAERFSEDVLPELRTPGYRGLDAARIDNAWLLSRLLYYTRLDDFELLYRQAGSVREAVAAMMSSARERDPWAALDHLLSTAAPAVREDAPAASGA